METQSNWGAAVRGVGVQFREFFDQVQDSYAPSWEPVVRYSTDDGAQATFSGKTGAGLPQRFGEGSTIPKGQRYKLYDTPFAHEQYGKQLEVSRKQLMNRDFADAFNEFKDLTVGMSVLKSKAPAQIFNNAFATTTTKNSVRVTLYQDGKALCSTVHPRVDGGTAQSNASSTGITLTDDNLETARIALALQLQDDGTPIASTGDLYLVVPMNLDKTARVITGSELKSGSMDNDVNIYTGGAIKVMTSKWLDSTNGGSNTAWFLVDASVSRLYMVMRTSGELDQSIDKNTKSTLFDIICDFSVGHADWRGVWGSKGDSSAYSG